MGRNPFITAAAAALLLSVCAFGQSYSHIIPKPQQVEAAKGQYHHKPGAGFAVRTDSTLGEEAYILSVTRKGVTITAGSPAGEFYARQSLAQMAGLTFGDIDSSDWTVDCCTIKDEPRLAYRGLMMDASRHFRSKEFILRHIDAMSKVKLNRLHFHLTDSEGWRLQIDSYPKLTEMAAWRDAQFCNDWRRGERKYLNKDEGFGGYYTKEDIREIVAYAAERHVTVVPEIEIPGHSREVCAAYPQLGCSGEAYQSSVLCPGKEETFVFIEKVLDEVMELFPSEYIHIGGDEVNKRQWATCPDCQRRMKEEGLKDVDELQSYTIKRVEKFVESRGRHIIGWDEILQGGLAPNATVMSWRGISGGSKASEQNHNVIMTPGKYCYIDAAQDKPDKEPAAYGVYLPLSKIYNYDPAEGLAKPSYLTGVQANLWAEYIVSDDYAEYMYWPRGLAIAEIGWTKPENKAGYAEFRERALEINRQMADRGYHVFDLSKEAGNRPDLDTPVKHLALGCKVTYNEGCKWSNSYPAAAEATFTDGLLGGWSYRDDRWQGFIGNVDVTVDLGEVKSVRHVDAEFYDHGWEMNVPVYAEVMLSKDGENFTTVATIGTKPEPVKADPEGRRRPRGTKAAGKAPFKVISIPEERGAAVIPVAVGADFNPQEARYVRFRTERGSFTAWYFMDELRVL